MRYVTFLILFTFGNILSAQVGVNTPTPTQALDVAGKILVADDATPPDRGTIRFNPANSEFEGYNGTEWKILSLEKSSDTPTSRIPYGGFSSPVAVGNQNASQTTINVAFRGFLVEDLTY